MDMIWIIQIDINKVVFWYLFSNLFPYQMKITLSFVSMSKETSLFACIDR